MSEDISLSHDIDYSDDNLYYPSAEVGKVFFAVTVTERRARFLARMLDVPLCDKCNRELDLCEADPCTDQTAQCKHCEGWFTLATLNDDDLCERCQRQGGTAMK